MFKNTGKAIGKFLLKLLLVIVAFLAWVVVIGLVELFLSGIGILDLGLIFTSGNHDGFFVVSVFGGGFVFALFISYLVNKKSIKSTLLFLFITAAFVILCLIINYLSTRYFTLTNKQLMNYVEKNCTFSFYYDENVEENGLVGPATKYIMLDEEKVYWRNDQQFGVCDLYTTHSENVFRYAVQVGYAPSSPGETEGGLVQQWDSDGEIKAVYVFGNSNGPSWGSPHFILIESRDGTIYSMQNHEIIFDLR